MSEQSNKWDRQWSDLLTHCYGGEVEADQGFKANLLADLKRKTAENATVDISETTADTADDHNWTRLLTAAYQPCEPEAAFKAGLLTKLKQKQQEVSQDVASEDTVLKTILNTSYVPVAPRKEFETRLLENLKERQRHTAVLRRKNRRRTLFLSGVSSLAAAAMVMFILTLTSTEPMRPAAPQPIKLDLAFSEAMAEPQPAQPARIEMASHQVDPTPEYAEESPSSTLAFANYTVEEAFSQPKLPSTVRGIGMEVDNGGGWHQMEEALIAWLTPGMSFRANPRAKFRGLGFGDGSTLNIYPDAVVETTEYGFTVRQGTVAVEVPDSSKQRFYLHFPERDVAVEPGSMVMVSVPSPELYADGGSPAPEIKVLDGGLALAQGKYGTGVLLSGQVYRLDRYVSAGVPGRPLCVTEFEELERMQPASVFSRVGGFGTGPIVTTDNRYTPARRPSGFTKRDAAWVADTYRDQPTIKIRYLSDEYFGLANKRRDLAASLALGSEVIIDGGDGQFYQIHE